MSLVVTKTHEETIHNILYKTPPSRIKSPLYVSAKERELKRLHTEIPKTHATMGYADVPLKKPDEYLKKCEGIRKSAEKQRKLCLVGEKLPSLPKPDTNFNKRNKQTLNFEARNKNMVKNAPPSGLKRSLVVVDSPDGHTSDVYKFKWVYNKSYGSLPKYLEKRMTAIRKEEDEYRQRLENQTPLCQAISAEERQEILDGLKENWSQLQKEFLRLPMLIDSLPKIIRKTKLEARLKQLEDDIKMIEENPYIYIYN